MTPANPSLRAPNTQASVATGEACHHGLRLQTVGAQADTSRLELFPHPLPHRLPQSPPRLLHRCLLRGCPLYQCPLSLELFAHLVVPNRFALPLPAARYHRLPQV